MIARQKIKETAKEYMRHDNNRSGMVGTVVLYRVLIASIWVVFFIALATAVSASGLFENTNLLRLIIGIFSALVIGLAYNVKASVIVQAPVDVGLKRYFLHIAQHGKRTRSSAIFDGFDYYFNILRARLAEWLRVELIVSVMALVFKIIAFISRITFLISDLDNLARLFHVSDLDNFARLLFYVGSRNLGVSLSALVDSILGLSILNVLLGSLVSIGLWFLHHFLFARMWAMRWVVAENPDISTEEALNRCLAMTRNHIWDLMVFEMSFIGWELLDVVTLGLASILYVDAYRATASALLYQELKHAPVQMRPGIAGAGADPTQASRIQALEQTVANLQRQVGSGHGSVTPPAPPATKPGIFCVRGMYAGNTFVLDPDKAVAIGRNPKTSQIVFHQGADKVSGTHCSVTFVSSERRYRVVDLSSNGTYAGGKRLAAKTPVMLERGTELMLADANNVIRLL